MGSQPPVDRGPENIQPPQPPEPPRIEPPSGPAAAEPPRPPGPPAMPQPPSPPPPPRGSRVNLALAVLAAVFFIGMVLSWIAVLLVAAGGWQEFGGKPAVALIKITGLITSESDASPLTGGGGGTLAALDQLRKAEKDDSVKAIVVWIDSPGGSPAAAEAVYSRMLEVRKKKPVVVGMGDVAASGGYYIASAATKIVACPSTETGSIGVIFSTFNVASLMERFGVRAQTMTTGPYKDTGSPFREMRPDERRLIESLLADIYEQFVADVARGRNMPKDKVRELADGRVFTGRQAKSVGLVDALGSRDDAIRLAAKLGGIEGWPHIKRYEKAPNLLSLLLGSAMDSRSRPWYLAVLERPGPWLTLPVPGAGFIIFTGAR